MRNSEDAPSPYVIPYVCMYTNWMVVSNMFIFHPYLLKWSNLTRMFFRWVVQPPTSIYTFIYLEPFADPAVTDWKRLVFWGVGWPSKIEVIGALHFGVNVFCPKKKVQGIPSAPWDCTISSTRNCRSHPLNSQVMLLNDSEYDMNIYTYHIYIYILCICVGVHYGSSNPQLFLAGTTIRIGCFDSSVLAMAFWWMSWRQPLLCTGVGSAGPHWRTNRWGTDFSEKKWVSHDLGGSRVFLVVVSNIFVNFHPIIGKIPILTNIFQMGWNHQPGLLLLS